MSKVSVVFAALLMSLGLAGCRGSLGGTEFPNDGMQGGDAFMTDQRSCAEIAEILKEFEIGGLTDEFVREMGDMYDGEDIDRTAMILYELGDGDLNWDTLEWTPAENGVYSFDAEVFDVENMCTNFLLGVSALGGDELVFTDIEENTENVNWEEGSGTRTVSFTWNGNRYTIEAVMEFDWIDTNVATKLNEIIMAENTGKQLFFANTDIFFVFYQDQEWAAAFQEKTGLELSDSFFSETYIDFY